MKVELEKLKCLRCGKEWVPRKTDIRQCPGCKSAFWDSPRKTKTEGNKEN